MVSELPRVDNDIGIGFTNHKVNNPYFWYYVILFLNILSNNL